MNAADQELEHKSAKPKKLNLPAIAAAVIWILSIGFALTIPGTSKYNWVADALLLFGFFPLLFAYPAGWTWFIFGLLNMAIGFILEVSYHVPDAALTKQLISLRQGFQASHPTLVWILMGALCTVYGIMRMFKNAYCFICLQWRKHNKKTSLT